MGRLKMARFVIDDGEGGFDVIDGVQLNSKPLSRIEADRLARRLSVAAAQPPPAPKLVAENGAAGPAFASSSERQKW
jgi:hypothetical protein